MVTFEIFLLGDIRLIYQDELLHLQLSPKEMALLVYLMWRGSPQSRTQLGQFFWEGRSPEQARSNLRTFLSRSRSTLNKYLVITREAIAFNPTLDYWLDVTEFKRQLKTADHLWRQEVVPQLQAVGRLTKALQLYRGPFLADLALPDSDLFMAWVESERESLQNEAISAWHKIVRFYLQRGDYALGIQSCQQLLALDPFDELAHAHLLRLLVYDDQVEAALTHYHAYCRQLDAQLSLTPGTALQDIYQQVKNGRLPRVTQVQESFTVSSPGTMKAHANHRLPLPTTPLIGRKREITQLYEQLRHAAYRLITLVGTGGIGKTHLALAAADLLRPDFLDGIVFVPLIGLSDGTAMITESVSAAGDERLAVAIANALNLTLRGHRGTREQLFAYLRTKELLLILDNLDYLVQESRAFVMDLLQAAPDVTILVTSREPLQIQAECVLVLQELPVPPEHVLDFADYEKEHYAGIQLFVERARRTFTQFELSQENIRDVAEVCRLVGGIPLAIELAAAWVGHFNSAEIATAIQHNLAFLQTPLHDRPPRHQSMTNVFQYSWGLLTGHEKRVLVQLAIFTGGFDREAAQAVADAPLPILVSLVNKSMLRLTSAGRYELHGLLRRFATQMWDEVMGKDARAHQQWQQLQVRYGRYYLHFMTTQAQALHGENPHEVIRAINTTLDNIHRAWQLMLEQDRFDLIVASTNGLSRFYHFAGLYREAASLFATTAAYLRLRINQEHTENPQAHIALVRVQSKHAFYYNRLGQFEQASRVAQLAAASARQYQDRYGEAECMLTWGEAIELQGPLDIPRQKYTAALKITDEIEARRLQARSLRLLGRIAWRDGDMDVADSYYQHALTIERARGDRLAEGQLLNALGLNAELRGELDLARTYFETGQQIYGKIGNQHRYAGMLQNLGGILFLRGAYEEAAVTLRQAVDLFHVTGDKRSEGDALRFLGSIVLKQRQPAAAHQHYQQALDIARDVNDRRNISATLRSLGFAHRFVGAYTAAQACFQEALANSQGVGDKTEIALLQNAIGLNHWSLGQYDLASHFCRRALDMGIGLINRTRFLADCVLTSYTLGEYETAGQYGQEGLVLAQRIDLPSFTARLWARLGDVRVQQGQGETAVSFYRHAITQFEAIGEKHLAQEPRAALAELFLRQQEPAKAQLLAQEVLCFLQHDVLDGTFAPLRAYLSLVRILSACGDERTQLVLQTAREQLHAQAMRIADETLRMLFMEQIPAHQEILQFTLVQTQDNS